MSKTYQEKLLDLVKEAFEKDLENLKKSYTEDNTVDGRPSFWVEPTRDEQMARFRDPGLRAEVEKQLYETGGPQAVLSYRRDMEKMSVVQIRNLGLGEED